MDARAALTCAGIAGSPPLGDPHPMTDDLLGAFNLELIDNDFGPYLLLRAHVQRGDQHLVHRSLDRQAPRSVLPERARLVRSIDGGVTFDLLVEVDDVLVLLRTWKANADVWATGADEATVNRVVREISDRMPPRAGMGQVDVCFTDNEAGSRYVAVDVRAWEDIAGNYSPAVRATLTTLTEHRAVASEARRLVLWHGAPGTGKTSAVRALLHSWQPWADAVVVNDPEALLGDSRYLRRVVLDQDDDANRWKLIVLEDAEALLRKDTGGRGMAKLLNLADGLLGQGLRCLWLITTNEEIGALHPALVRPGRCLARLEFGALPAAQAAALLGRPVTGPMTLAEVFAARPLAVEAQPIAVGQYL